MTQTNEDTEKLSHRMLRPLPQSRLCPHCNTTEGVESSGVKAFVAGSFVCVDCGSQWDPQPV